MSNTIIGYEVNRVYYELEPFKEAALEKEISALEEISALKGEIEKLADEIKPPIPESTSFWKFLVRLIMFIVNYFLEREEVPKSDTLSRKNQEIELKKKELATLRSTGKKAELDKIDLRRRTVDYLPQLTPIQTHENGNQIVEIGRETLLKQTPVAPETDLKETLSKINFLLDASPIRKSSSKGAGQEQSIMIIPTIFNLTLQARALINIAQEKCIAVWTWTVSQETALYLSTPTKTNSLLAIKEKEEGAENISKQEVKRSYESLTEYRFLPPQANRIPEKEGVNASSNQTIELPPFRPLIQTSRPNFVSSPKKHFISDDETINIYFPSKRVKKRIVTKRPTETKPKIEPRSISNNSSKTNVQGYRLLTTTKPKSSSSLSMATIGELYIARIGEEITKKKLTTKAKAESFISKTRAEAQKLNSLINRKDKGEGESERDYKSLTEYKFIAPLGKAPTANYGTFDLR